MDIRVHLRQKISAIAKNQNVLVNISVCEEFLITTFILAHQKYQVTKSTTNSPLKIQMVISAFAFELFTCLRDTNTSKNNDMDTSLNSNEDIAFT